MSYCVHVQRSTCFPSESFLMAVYELEHNSPAWLTSIANYPLLSAFPSGSAPITAFCPMLIFINYILLTTLLHFSWFPPLPPPPSTPHSLRQCPTIVQVHGSCAEVLWLLPFLHCTLHPHDCSLTTYLYFLIPSPLHPFPQTPSHLATIKKHYPYPWFCLCSLLSFVF